MRLSFFFTYNVNHGSYTTFFIFYVKRKTHPTNKMWDIFDIPCQNEFEQESGQLVINKLRPDTWKSLHLATYLQTQKKIYFQLSLGDKDTFRFAWKALGTPYHYIRSYLSIAGFITEDRVCGHSMLQWTPYGGKGVFGDGPGSPQEDDEEPDILFLHGNFVSKNNIFFLNLNSINDDYD